MEVYGDGGRNHHGLKDCGQWDAPNVAYLYIVRDDASQSAAALGFIVFDYLSGKIVPTEAEDNRWTVAKKDRLPFHLVDAVENDSVRETAEVEKRHRLAVEAIAPSRILMREWQASVVRANSTRLKNPMAIADACSVMNTNTEGSDE